MLAKVLPEAKEQFELRVASCFGVSPYCSGFTPRDSRLRPITCNHVYNGQKQVEA